MLLDRHSIVIRNSYRHGSLVFSTMLVTKGGGSDPDPSESNILQYLDQGQIYLWGPWAQTPFNYNSLYKTTAA